MTRRRFTQSQYEALLDAYSSGTLSYSYMGQTIVHRSLDEMERILDRMEAYLFPDAPNTPMSRRYTVRPSFD